MRSDIPFPLTHNLASREVRLSLFFVLALFISGLFSISLSPIGGSSEAREAHVIKLMVEQDDYILPLRNGIIPSKPPLYHWIGALISSTLNNFSPFTARIPSLLAGALVLWLVMAIGAELGGTRVERRERMLVWSGIVLATSYEFEKMRTVAMVDMVFCLCVTLAIAPVIYRMIVAGSSNRLDEIVMPVDMSAFFLFSGLAVLAKGPIGVVLPAMLLMPALAHRSGFFATVKFMLQPRIGWIFFVLLACPWYLLAALRQSREFLGRQIIFENLSRFTGGEHITVRPWWYYIPAWFRVAAPWSTLLIVQFITEFRRSTPSANRTLSRGLSLSILIAICFFSAAEGKRDSYLLPLLPWMAVALCPAIISWIDLMTQHRRMGAERFWERTALGIATVGALFLMFMELARLNSWHASSPLLWHFQLWIGERILPVSVVVFAALFLIPALKRFGAPPYWMLAARALVPVLVLSTLLALGLSVRNRLKNFEAVAERVNVDTGGKNLVVARKIRDEFFDGIFYYLNRQVHVLDPDLLPERCDGYTLIRFDQWQELRGRGRLSTAREVGVYTEVDDLLAGTDKNQKVLIECQEDGSVG